jgi:hypothetical protein
LAEGLDGFLVGFLDCLLEELLSRFQALLALVAGDELEASFSHSALR